MASLIRILARLVISTFRPYNINDNSEYWRRRASDEGQSAVLWKNESYNRRFRKQQRTILDKYLKKLKTNASILDIGCGIGVVSEIILDIRSDLKIDAVDFPEMIEIAENRLFDRHNVVFIKSSAENYKPDKKYDIVLSSACYSAIKNIQNFWKAIENGTDMVKSGGILLMIDPFHKAKILARVRVAGDDVVDRVISKGFTLIEKSGVLFWPFRMMLSNSNLSDTIIRKRFELGERLLKLIGKYRFSDYKIIALKKK